MEWSVVTVLVVLVGLFATIGAPIIKLIVTLTRLTVLLDTLYKEHNDNTCANRDAHEKFEAHVVTHDRVLQDHEQRLFLIDGREPLTK